MRQEGITDRDRKREVQLELRLQTNYWRFFYHSGISVLNQPLATASFISGTVFRGAVTIDSVIYGPW